MNAFVTTPLLGGGGQKRGVGYVLTVLEGCDTLVTNKNAHASFENTKQIVSDLPYFS